ncbi:MAG: TA system VapC family ribonuclease toxin [Verrucomicrobiota bacterium]
MDANVWLALAFSDHVHHAKAVSWFATQPEQSCAFCRVTQMALLRHLTNTHIMGRFVQTQAAAWQTFDSFATDPRSAFLSEPDGVETRFRNLTQAASPGHGRWTDAYLAALAIESNVGLVTLDKGFVSCEGLMLELLQ